MRWLLLALLTVVAFPCAANGPRIWVVDDDRAQAPAADFTRIAEALTAAAAGDTVVVQPGYYPENLRVGPQDVHLRGSAPESPAAVAVTIVDGRLLGSVIELDGRESPACIIEGLTLQNGQAEFGGAIRGGVQTPSRATIRNNVLRSNFALVSGGAIHGVDGLIAANLIESNRARQGGGLAFCNGVIESNTLRANTAIQTGGGLYQCTGGTRRNVIEANTCPTGPGGGLAQCSGLIELNRIEANTARLGGGAANLFGRVERNQFAANAASENGGALAQGEATLVSNTLERNTAALDGGALALFAGRTIANTFTANLARSGGGLWRCTGPIEGNTIESNVATFAGGALADCDGRIAGNLVRDNRASTGGGLHGCDGRIAENRIEANRATHGGGLSACDAWIQCNLITSNLAVTTSGLAGLGSALADGAGHLLHNTIAWNGGKAWPADAPASVALGSGCLLRANLLLGNAGPALGWPAGPLPAAVVDEPAPLLPDLTLPAALHPVALTNAFFGNGALGRVATGELLTTAAALEAALPGSTGNLATDPLITRGALLAGSDPATWQPADYLPLPGSPLIDAGTLHPYAIGAARDVRGHARITGGRTDIGALEAGALADADGDALSDVAEATFGADPARPDTDGDGAPDGLELLRGGNPITPETGAGLTAGPSPARAPQEALTLAYRGERVTLLAGQVFETLVLEGKWVRLAGPPMEAGTTTPLAVLDGAGAGPVLTLDNATPTSSVIERVALVNGRAAAGAAVQGNAGSPTLQDLLVSSCTTRTGGTVEQMLGPIRRSAFIANTAGEGGGLRLCRGPLEHLQFIGNHAASGGALARTSGAVRFCRFEGNTALGEGGALARTTGPLSDSVLIGNRAAEGGAGALGQALLERCVLTSNTAESGGALHGWGGIIQDSTFTLNRAERGGAINGAGKVVSRCLFDDNAATANGGAVASAFGGIEDCTFTGNAADGNGGAVVDAEQFVTRCLFRGNRAGSGGGAVALMHAPIQACRLEGNQAIQGGALFACDDVVGNWIIGNTASVIGGGISSGQGQLVGNELRGNRAVQGGAIASFAGSLRRNLIRGNRAENRGGALWFCRAELQNNLLIDNATTLTVLDGGAVPGGGAAAECSGRWQGNLFAWNDAAETTGGVVLDSTPELIANLWLGGTTVLVRASASTREPLGLVGNWIDRPGAALLRSGGEWFGSLAEAEAARASWTGNFTGPAELAGPLAADAPAEAFQPLPGSPLIDAGGAGLSEDYAGLLRPLDGDGDGVSAADIGPWEYRPRSAVRHWLRWD